MRLIKFSLSVRFPTPLYTYLSAYLPPLTRGMQKDFSLRPVLFSSCNEFRWCERLQECSIDFFFSFCLVSSTSPARSLQHPRRLTPDVDAVLHQSYVSDRDASHALVTGIVLPCADKNWSIIRADFHLFQIWREKNCLGYMENI